MWRAVVAEGAIRWRAKLERIAGAEFMRDLAFDEGQPPGSAPT